MFLILRTGITKFNPEIALIRCLEHHGWGADTQLEHPSYTYGSPLEDLATTAEEREQIIQSQLRDSAESKRALIIKVSHVGGHKYAGNCIVRFFSHLLPPRSPPLITLGPRFIRLKALACGMVVSLHMTLIQLLSTLSLAVLCYLPYSAEGLTSHVLDVSR